uniref:Secreted protein n=1 Tax=Anopheles darlingi TaxID=43151 RepID=A0A2M4DG48_ANODA
MSLRTWCCCMHALLCCREGPFALVTDVICRTTRTTISQLLRIARERMPEDVVATKEKRREGGSEESICFLGQAKTRCSSFGFGLVASSHELVAACIGFIFYFSASLCRVEASQVYEKCNCISHTPPSSSRSIHGAELHLEDKNSLAVVVAVDIVCGFVPVWQRVQLTSEPFLTAAAAFPFAVRYAAAAAASASAECMRH